MSSTEAEDFTARELGLLTGQAWAIKAEPHARKQIADEGEVPDDVKEMVLRAGFADRLGEFGDRDAAEQKYWQGFVHGVRAFVVGDLNRVANLN